MREDGPVPSFPVQFLLFLWCAQTISALRTSCDTYSDQNALGSGNCAQCTSILTSSTPPKSDYASLRQDRFGTDYLLVLPVLPSEPGPHVNPCLWCPETGVCGLPYPGHDGPCGSYSPWGSVGGSWISAIQCGHASTRQRELTFTVTGSQYDENSVGSNQQIGGSVSDASLLELPSAVVPSVFDQTPSLNRDTAFIESLVNTYVDPVVSQTRVDDDIEAQSLLVDNEDQRVNRHQHQHQVDDAAQRRLRRSTPARPVSHFEAAGRPRIVRFQPYSRDDPSTQPSSTRGSHLHPNGELVETHTQSWTVPKVSELNHLPVQGPAALETVNVD